MGRRCADICYRRDRAVAGVVCRDEVARQLNASYGPDLQAPAADPATETVSHPRPRAKAYQPFDHLHSTHRTALELTKTIISYYARRQTYSHITRPSI